jgi:hypothetical protein
MFLQKVPHLKMAFLGATFETLAKALNPVTVMFWHRFETFKALKAAVLVVSPIATSA